MSTHVMNKCQGLGRPFRCSRPCKRGTSRDLLSENLLLLVLSIGLLTHNQKADNFSILVIQKFLINEFVLKHTKYEKLAEHGTLHCQAVPSDDLIFVSRLDVIWCAFDHCQEKKSQMTMTSSHLDFNAAFL